MRKTESTLLDKTEAYLVGIHILFGFIAVFARSFVPVLFVLVSLLYVVRYARHDYNKYRLLVFASYLMGLEILNRSVGTTFLPYEVGKYVQIGFIIVNIIIARTWFTSIIGIFIILLILPSFIIFQPALIKNLIFNTLGMMTLGFMIAFTAYQKISVENLSNILKAFLLPCITFVTYITLKTPDYSTIDFTLSSSVETSGGFGSNQVATLLGAGICFMVLLLDQKYYIGNRLITIGLLVYFTLRAFLTFSRGGIIGMVLSVLLAFIFFRKIKQSSVIKLLLLTAGFVIIFIISDNITGGQLLLRYQGETSATLSGNREKNLETLSSGRNNIAAIDIAMWLDNFIIGVGPGNLQFLRYKYGDYEDQLPPHTEQTRLLAENGIFGLVINIIIILWPIHIIWRTRDRNMKFIKCMLFIFAYATMFHSAIRTGLTPLLYGLASMDINQYDTEKPELHDIKKT
jgi:Lipid A core - O-antigen ligase and related enzymes